MLNADGVVVGNTRSSIGGLDLNRHYLNPDLKEAPEIRSIKNVIRQTLINRKIFMYCDFHSHSRAKNIFIYGCSNNYSREDIMKERIFPMLMHQNCDSFNFDNCKFDVHPSKESTGRVCIRKQFNIINSYTLECGVSGPTRGKYSSYHFNIQLYK